jgi:hypothetical protein
MATYTLYELNLTSSLALLGSCFLCANHVDGVWHSLGYKLQQILWEDLAKTLLTQIYGQS